MTYKKGLLFIQQKSSKMFLMAFLVSLTIWLLINLSKTYEKIIAVNLSYSNLEEGTFVKTSDSILKVKIKGSGFTLLSHKLAELEFEINTQEFQNKWVWETDDSGLNTLFSRNIEVTNVTPRTVVFDIKMLSKKKVPIVSRVKFFPKLGYGITVNNLSKDSILIYGDQVSIDTISAIKTDVRVFDNSIESIRGDIGLDYKNKGIQIETKSIEYSCEIEQFTQGDFLVEVKAKNIPDDKSVTIFPKEVHVQFQAPLSKFIEYKAEDFGVFVDINDINEANALPVYIEYLPKGVVNARVLKKSVTYLVLEK
jgi:hypothetical protein